MFAPKKFFIVAIGFSAGGRHDLDEFFSHLPPNPNAAFIVIQHLDRNHKSIADLLLTHYTNLPVSWAKDHDQVMPNHIYLLPANKFMTLKDGYLEITDRNPLNLSNWAVDIFFNSMAESVKEMGIGIVLSGAGSDGALGALHMHQEGGTIMVQDPSTALFTGMPLAAILKDNPDEILSPRMLADALMNHISVKTAN